MNHGLPPMAAAERGTDEFGEVPRPPLDPVVAVVADRLPKDPITPAEIPEMRAGLTETAASTLAGLEGITHTEHVIPGHEDAEIAVSVFRPDDASTTGPGLLWIHGGGLVTGNRFSGARTYLELMQRHGGTVVTVEYRLAPEHPAPIPVEDCYAALLWTHGNAAELGLDPDRLVIAGSSAGGCLAAGVMLLARDRSGPRAAGVLLECPMLDDRNHSTAIRQYRLAVGWSGDSNEVAWDAALGADRGTAHVSPYDAPARATWFGDLPPVHIGVGSADPFRDEDVAFASAIWRDGGECELLVVPGGNHGFEAYAPDASITRAMIASREGWLERVITPDDPAIALAAIPALVAANPRMATHLQHLVADPQAIAGSGKG